MLLDWRTLFLAQRVHPMDQAIHIHHFLVFYYPEVVVFKARINSDLFASKQGKLSQQIFNLNALFLLSSLY